MGYCNVVGISLYLVKLSYLFIESDLDGLVILFLNVLALQYVIIYDLRSHCPSLEDLLGC